MSKLIPMEQAAAMLGISVDKLNELRSTQEIFGYKDGGTWKFKKTELERVADVMGISLGDAGLLDKAADLLPGGLAGKASGIAEEFGLSLNDSDEFDLDLGDSEELLLDDSSSSDSMDLNFEEQSSSIELTQSRTNQAAKDKAKAEDGVTLDDSGLLLDDKDDDIAGLLDSGSIKLGDSGSIKLDGSALSLGDDDDDIASLLDSGSIKVGDSESIKLGDSGLSLKDDDDDIAGLLDSGSIKIGDSGSLKLDDKADSIKAADSGSFKFDDSGPIDLGDSGSIKLDDSGELLSGLSSVSPPTVSKDTNLSADEGKSSDSGSLKLDESGLLDFGSESEVLGDDEQLSFGTSDINLASESSKNLGVQTGSDTGSDVFSEEPAKDGTNPADTGKMTGTGDGDDDLLLAEDDLFEDELVLDDSASFEDSSELGSDFEESDLVLEDSDSNSELALEANGSGILLSPNESGISLGDEPLELGGSDIDALELPSGDDDEMIILEDVADPEAATMMQEDDFNLTPLEPSLDGEDSNSSSQVIALEDSEIYADESAATILGDSVADFGAEPALIEEGVGLTQGGFADDGMMSPTMEAEMVGSVAAAQPEAPFTFLNVAGLALAALILFVSSLLAYDMCRNLWIGDNAVVSSGILNFLIDQLGMKS